MTDSKQLLDRLRQLIERMEERGVDDDSIEFDFSLDDDSGERELHLSWRYKE